MIVDDVIGNVVESVYLILLARGHDVHSLPNHLEAYAQRYEYFKQSGFEFASIKLREAHSQKLLSRGEETHVVCEQLLGWENAAADRSKDTNTEAGRIVLVEAFQGRIFRKCSSQAYEKFYRDLRNAHVSKAG